jgi:predicted anti-sigma-YlaC factor YlaD
VRPVLVYTLSRIGLFGITLGVLALVRVPSLLEGLVPAFGWLLTFVLAFVISGVASFVLLSKQRDAVSSKLSDKLDRPKPTEEG